MGGEATTAESAWAPLSHPVFRALWISSLVSNNDVVPAPDEGPVRVEVEYRVDPLQTDAFVEAIRDLEPIRRRDGAVTWAVYQDPGRTGRYVESFIVESWLEHLRQHERATVGDRTVQERIRPFHIAGAPPSVTHLIAAKFRRL